MKAGDRVLVHASWSSYLGMRGRVTSTSPYLAVLLDGDRSPIRVGELEVILEAAQAAEPSLTGAE